MTTSSKTARIVLVEDNPADVYLVRKALLEKGIDCDLRCFEDGRHALKGLAQRDSETPDLILLDLNLPDTDGVAVLGKIRGMPRLFNVPVVILTSSESPTDMQRTERMGATSYLRKPSGLEEFFREVGRTVEEILGRQRGPVG